MVFAKVADPHHFDADPHPGFDFNADLNPELAFHSNADPHPAPSQSDGNLRPLVYRPSTALN
jgi:hypothetical protein